ncbi:hypothetical protein GOB92_30605 [Sinorhizobium meliloti]|nr:hypothetical protein [Sinorhizobium meliloti]
MADEFGISRQRLYEWRDHLRLPLDLDFFASLAAGRSAWQQRSWRNGIFKAVEKMTTGLSPGEFNMDRMCWLAGVSRASYYRHRLDSAAGGAKTGLRPCCGGRGGESTARMVAGNVRDHVGADRGHKIANSQAL